MPDKLPTRIDELPLDRRVSGSSRGMSRDPQLPAIFERREVDPVAPHFKRRTGSIRDASVNPNLLGLTADSAGAVAAVDYDFSSDISSWTVTGTVHIPAIQGQPADDETRIMRIDNFELFVFHNATTDQVRLSLRTIAGVSVFESASFDSTTSRTLHYSIATTQPTGSADTTFVVWEWGTSPGTGQSATRNVSARDGLVEFFGVSVS